MQMVDVSSKRATLRTATAMGRIRVGRHICEMISAQGFSKGDVFSVAQFAGIMAAKFTSQLIPLCHPILLSKVDVKLSFGAEAGVINIESFVKSVGMTGVEMEALLAVSAAALTVYDMCKSASQEMVISEICLVEKTGGKTAYRRRGVD
eukprot:Sdes_comp20086_c0_seq2m13031